DRGDAGPAGGAGGPRQVGSWGRSGSSACPSDKPLRCWRLCGPWTGRASRQVGEGGRESTFEMSVEKIGHRGELSSGSAREGRSMRWAIVGVFLLLAAPADGAEAKRKPNIVFILADDLG